MKSRIAFIVAVAFVALLVASCASTQSPWIGKTADELIAQRGNPERVVDDRDGGKILVYGVRTNEPDRSALNPGNRASEPLHEVGVSGLHFYVNKDGVIYAVR